jgi:uncharacterized membrane protein
MNGFSAGSCIRFGWETFKKRPWFLIGAYILFFVVVGLISAALNLLINYGAVLALVSAVARLAVDMLVGMGTIAFTLKAHDDIEHLTLMDFWRPYPFWKYVGSTVLFGIISIVGFVLLIVPGIIWSIMFGFAGYLVVDKKMWPIEALKESKRITYGYKWELFWLGILTLLILLLGAVCLLVGIFVAYPVTILAIAHAYRTLEARSMNSSGRAAIA